jgi:hypothetical protein
MQKGRLEEQPLRVIADPSPHDDDRGAAPWSLTNI